MPTPLDSSELSHRWFRTVSIKSPIKEAARQINSWLSGWNPDTAPMHFAFNNKPALSLLAD
jgi:hypothetical protein